MDALNQLKKQGKDFTCRSSKFYKGTDGRANKYCEIEAYQPQFSMVDRDNEELIRWAHAQDMGVMTYGTLGGGNFNRKIS